MKHSKTVLSLILSAIVLAASATSCVVRINMNDQKAVSPQGNVVTRTVVPEKDFTTTSMAGSFDLEIIQSEGDPRIEVTTYENIQDLFRPMVKNGNLGLSFGNDSVRIVNLKDTRVVLYVSDLRGVSLAGSGDLSVPSMSTEKDFRVSLAGSGDISIGSLSCGELSFSVAGSGDISAKGISCGSLEASVAGSGDVTLSGTAEAAKYSVAGSGDINAKGLKAGDVKTSKAGSGTISY